MYEADGAVWLRTTDFDDDKDRVLVKADGELTYFASDTAYYVDKRDRGFDVCIYLLGADHHGYVNRLRAVAACAGDDPDVNIEVLIGQLVKMVKGGEEVRLSKRAGNMITLEDLVDEVGVDAARYSLIRYPVDSPLDARPRPARARAATTTRSSTCSTRTRGSPRCCAAPPTSGIDWRAADVDLVAAHARARERRCSALIGEFPRVVATAAELREPHRVARYLEELATATTSSTTSAGCCPMADAEVEPINVAAPVAVRRRAADPRQRPRHARRQRARADVTVRWNARRRHGAR